MCGVVCGTELLGCVDDGYTVWLWVSSTLQHFYLPLTTLPLPAPTPHASTCRVSPAPSGVCCVPRARRIDRSETPSGLGLTKKHTRVILRAGVSRSGVACRVQSWACMRGEEGKELGGRWGGGTGEGGWGGRRMGTGRGGLLEAVDG
jgi:hypothetical protein